MEKRNRSFIFYCSVIFCGLVLSLSSCSTLHNHEKATPLNSQRLFAKQELFRKSEKAIVDAHAQTSASSAALDTRTSAGTENKTTFIALPKMQLPNVYLSQRIVSALAPRQKKKVDTCDLIILNSGEEIRGKVTEIGLQEIRYRKCENLDGPTVVIEKSDVFIIHYANGTKEVINGKPGSDGQDQYRNNSGRPQNTQPAAPEKKTITTIGEIGGWCSVIGWAFCFFEATYAFALILLLAATVFEIADLLLRAAKPDEYSMKGWGFVLADILLNIFLIILLIILLG